MGAESSRLSVIWSVLDDDKDGFITASELEEWFRDEAFLDNRLFSPHHNGVTSIHQLAQSFLHSVDRDHDERVSFDELKSYTEGMKEDEIEDLAQSLVSVNEDKKRKAIKKVFMAIDTNNNLYWTQEDAERFIQNEAVYQSRKGATPEQSELGVADMRAKLFPQPDPTQPDHPPSSSSSSSPPIVTFEQLCTFFSSWPLREIRKHTEDLVTSAMEKKRELTLLVIKQRRLSRSEISSGGGESASVSRSRSRFSSAGAEHEMSEVGEMKELPEQGEEDGVEHQLQSLSVNIVPPSSGGDLSVTISSAPASQSLSASSSSSSSSLDSIGSDRPSSLSLSLPPAALSDLLTQMSVLHDEISALNAQQREMNEESRRLSDRLMSIDQSRLTITTSLNDIQAELTANHSRHVLTTKQRSGNEEKLKAVLKRFEDCAEEGHRLSREIEVCRETLVSMKAEVNELAKASKQVPDHLKVLERSVADETVKLQLSTKAQKDAQQMIAMLESELSAQEKALEGVKGGPGVAALVRLRSKLAGYRKVEREKGDEMKQSSEALRKWEEEKEGDEELKRIGGKMALYKKSVQEKKEQLSALQKEYEAQQAQQDKLDTERRQLYNDIIQAKKTEKAVLTRIQQLSENYAQGDSQVALLGKEKDERVKAARALVEMQGKVDERMTDVMMELECLCDDVIKAKEEEDEEQRREEVAIEEEERRLKDEMDLKMANGWVPDDTYVPPLPYVRPDLNKPMMFCCPLWIDVEGKRVHGIVHINRFMLTIENCVQAQQKRDEDVRVCVDVSEIIDLKLKAADQTGVPTLTLQRMPSPVKGQAAAPVTAVSSSPNAAAGAAPPVAMPVVKSSSPRKPLSRRASLSGLIWSGSSKEASNASATQHTSESSPSSATTTSTSSSLSASGLVSQVYEAATSLLDTVAGPVSDAVSSAASAVASTVTSSSSAAASSSPASSTAPSTPTSFDPAIVPLALNPSLPLTASQSFTTSQPFSPALSPSTLQPALRRSLSLAARQISLTLRPNYRNRFLVPVDGDKSPPTTLTPINRIHLTAEELHLKTLFECIRLSIHARRRRSTPSVFALSSPPSTPHSLMGSPTSAPSTPTNRPTPTSLAVSQSASKPKETFAERQARKKRRREKKERELQHRRELQQLDEEVYVEGQSEILPLSFIQRLVRSTPARYHLSVWRCVYSMTVHGVSFDRLLAVMADKSCALVMVKDMKGRRFGGYISTPFVSNAQAMNAYYGSGECFVFQVRQKTDEERLWDEKDKFTHPALNDSADFTHPDETVALYRWSGLNDYFMFTGTDPVFIAMGGGGAFAWRLDASLRYGSSGECSTYQSPTLASGKDFEAILFEVWAPVHEKF